MGATSQASGERAGMGGRLAAPGALVALVALVVELLGGAGLGLGLLLVPAAVLLLVLGARPLLLRMAPAEPDALKLALFGLALSPPLALVLWLLLRLVLPGGAAMPGLLLLLLLVQLTGPGGAPRWPRPSGKAAAVALVLALVFAGLVALAMFGGGTAIRASFHGLLHSSITEEVGRSLPPENPWLAGRPLPYYWAWHGLGALLGDALGLAPTMALALTNVWAALVLPLALYFLAAPYLQEPKRDLAAVLLGLLGLNLLGGWVLLATRPDFVAPEGPLQLLAGLRALVAETVTGAGATPDWDPRLAWGPSKFGNLSSYPAALALLLAGWVAAAHALRGRWGSGTSASARTWAVLCAASLGASLAMNPLVGAAGLATVGLVALVHGRVWLLAAMALAALPGLIEVHTASRIREGASFELRFDGGAAWSALLPVLPLLLCALPLLLRAKTEGEATEDEGSEAASETEGREEARATAGRLLLVCSLFCLAVAALVVFPEDNQYKFVRLAAFPLAVLAAGGLGRLLAARDLTAKGLGAVAALVLVLGACASSWWGARHYSAWSTVEVPLAEADGRLLPGGDGDLARAFGQLRAYASQLAGGARPMLVVPLGDRATVIAEPASVSSLETRDLWSYDGHQFRGVHNLQGHEAAAFAGMSLFTDERSYLVESDPTWSMRQYGLEDLAGFSGSHPSFNMHFKGLHRPTFLLHPLGARALGGGWLPGSDGLIPTAAGQSRLPDPDASLASLGFEVIWTSGEATIYADERAREALAHTAPAD